MIGWISLHRKLMDWEWYKDSHMVHLFIHFLLKANRGSGKWKKIEIKRGQLVTGRAILSKETGISERSIRTCLQRLQSTNELTIKSTNKFSIITICNYDYYQNKKVENDQQIDQPAVRQSTTNNNIINKEVINIVEYLNQKTGKSFKPNTKNTIKHISARLKEDYSQDDFIKVIDTKTLQWKGTDYENYLRPETLFGAKFESYLNEKPVNGKPQKEILEPATGLER